MEDSSRTMWISHQIDSDVGFQPVMHVNHQVYCSGRNIWPSTKVDMDPTGFPASFRCDIQCIIIDRLTISLKCFSHILR